jgi:hypothetical protein
MIRLASEVPTGTHVSNLFNSPGKAQNIIGEFPQLGQHAERDDDSILIVRRGNAVNRVFELLIR